MVLQESNQDSVKEYAKDISSASEINFQPMNANWGIVQTDSSKKDRESAIQIALDEVKQRVLTK